MAWRSIATTDIRLTPAERNALQAIQDSDAVCQDILDNVVAEFRAAIESKGGTLGDTGTIDDLVRVHVINRTRWLWLVEFPTMKAFQTKERGDLNAAAEKMLADILSGDANVTPPEGPTEGRGGSWGSETKLQMRTHQEES